MSGMGDGRGTDVVTIGVVVGPTGLVRLVVARRARRARGVGGEVLQESDAVLFGVGLGGQTVRVVPIINQAKVAGQLDIYSSQLYSSSSFLLFLVQKGKLIGATSITIIVGVTLAQVIVQKSVATVIIIEGPGSIETSVGRTYYDLADEDNVR